MLSSVKSWWKGEEKTANANNVPTEQKNTASEASSKGDSDAASRVDTVEGHESTPTEGVISQSSGSVNELTDYEADVDAELKKIYSAARGWSNYLYSLGKNASKIAVKSVSETAKQLADQVSEADLLSKAPILSEFQREQERFISEQTGESNRNPSGSTNPSLSAQTNVPDYLRLLHWNEFEDPEAVRRQIADLALEERHFLHSPPMGLNFSFVMTKELQKFALTLLKEDEKLQQMRFRLVPRKIDENTFWRNYFYRISLIQQSALLHTGHVANTATSPSQESPLETAPPKSPTEPTVQSSEPAPNLSAPTKPAPTEDWEAELQRELQDFSTETVDDEDADLEKELMEQLAESEESQPAT